MQAVCRPKALAKQLVSQYALGENEARFGVVSFNESATTRKEWSTNQADIEAGIGAMEADGKSSISAGLDAARQLFNHSREGATKVVLLVANGEQSNELAANGKTSQQTAIDAAMLGAPPRAPRAPPAALAPQAVARRQKIRRHNYMVYKI